jgi:hypothetical protein
VAFAIVESAITHNNIGGLTTGDPHTQYALLAGRSGGQTLIGGTAASNTLTLKATSNATKGKILFGASCYDEVNDWLGIGTTATSTTQRAGFSYAPSSNSGTYTTVYVQNLHAAPGSNTSTIRGLYVEAIDRSDSGSTGSIVGTYSLASQNGLASFSSAIAVQAVVSTQGGDGEGGYFTVGKGVDISSSAAGDGIGTMYGVYINDLAGTVAFGIWQNSTTNPNRFGGEIRVQGDTGGAASHNTFTGTSNIAANSTGVGTILFKGTTNRNSTGFIKIYIGTTAYYIPVFSAITG